MPYVPPPRPIYRPPPRPLPMRTPVYRPPPVSRPLPVSRPVPVHNFHQQNFQRQQQFQQQQRLQQQRQQQQQRLQMDRQRQQQFQQQQQRQRQQQFQLQQRLEQERRVQYQRQQQEFRRQEQERVRRQQHQFSHQTASGPSAPPPVQPMPQPVPPPPYSEAVAGPPQDLYPPLPASTDPPANQPSSAPPSTLSPAKVVLMDGTQIVIQKENEFQFIGPTGVRMVINCLPLFDHPSLEDTPPALPSVQEAVSQSDEAVSEAVSQSDEVVSQSDEVVSEAVSQSDETVSQSDETVSQSDEAVSQSDEAVSQSDEENLISNFSQDEVIEVSVASGYATFFLNESPPEPNPQSSAPSSTTPSPPQPTAPPTPLPPSPPTIEPDYVERSGWLTKLSHRRGAFGEKWQKRFFVLRGPWLFYYKKQGDSTPRGCVHLWPLGWCLAAAKGSVRMPDAEATGYCGNDYFGYVTIAKPNCFAVHRPSNFSASLSNLLSSDDMAEVCHLQTVSAETEQSASRTFYMTASSNEERDAWVEAISNNLRAYSHSSEAQKIATKELRSMLRAVKSSLSDSLPSVLLLLHRKRRELLESHRQHCSQQH